MCHRKGGLRKIEVVVRLNSLTPTSNLKRKYEDCFFPVLFRSLPAFACYPLLLELFFFHFILLDSCFPMMAQSSSSYSPSRPRPGYRRKIIFCDGIIQLPLLISLCQETRWKLANYGRYQCGGKFFFKNFRFSTEQSLHDCVNPRRHPGRRFRPSVKLPGSCCLLRSTL